MEIYQEIKEGRGRNPWSEADASHQLEGSPEASDDEVLKNIKKLLTLQAAIPGQILKEIRKLEEIINKNK